MGKPVFYISGQSAALNYAKAYLKRWNCPIADTPTGGVTHLLLPVPLFDYTEIPPLLAALPPSVTVMGGKLQDAVFDGYTCCDLLKDPWYVAENAAITAH